MTAPANAQPGTVRNATRLGQMLLTRGLISGEQLLRAIQAQDSVGGRIGTHLVEMGALDEDRLLALLAEQLAVPAVDADTLTEIPPAIVELVPAPVARRCLAVPFAADEHTISVATPNVHNLNHLDEIAFCSNRRVRPYVANEARVHEALAKFWGIPLPERFSLLLVRLDARRYVWRGDQDEAGEDEVRSNGARPPAETSTPRPVEPVPDAVIERPTAEPLSITDLEQALAADPSADSIGALLLRYLAQSFDRAALFKIQRRQVVGWLAHGRQVDDERFADFVVSLDEPSVFTTLAAGSELHFGPLPATTPHRALAACWGGELPTQSVLMPVRLSGRLVTVLYGDRGARGLKGLNVERFARLSRVAATAFEQAIRSRKRSEHSN